MSVGKAAKSTLTTHLLRLPATCYLLPATCYLLPATCYLLPATCSYLLVSATLCYYLLQPTLRQVAEREKAAKRIQRSVRGRTARAGLQKRR